MSIGFFLLEIPTGHKYKIEFRSIIVCGGDDNVRVLDVNELEAEYNKITQITFKCLFSTSLFRMAKMPHSSALQNEHKDT